MQRTEERETIGKRPVERLKELGKGLRVGRVLGRRVLVRAVVPFTEMDRVEKETNLIVPKWVRRANEPPPSTGVVIQVGSGVEEVTVGDMILFSRHAGGDYKIDEEDFKILEEKEIICTLVDTQDVVQPVVMEEEI